MLTFVNLMRLYRDQNPKKNEHCARNTSGTHSAYIETVEHVAG
jgi:hypothetical protein